MTASMQWSTRRVQAKRRLPPILLLLTLLLVAACGGAGGGGTRPSASGAPVPAQVQELIVGVGADQFTVPINQKRMAMYPLNAGVCETLMRMTTDFQLAPGLATAWRYLGNNTFSFTVRDGVTFQNGAPLTADAVKYTFDYTVKDPYSGYSFLTNQSTTVVDSKTVTVVPSKPNLTLAEQMVHPFYSIIAPGTDPTVKPVCTGPFQFVEYVPNDHLTVTRFDGYWGPKAKLTKITFRFIPDANTRILALQSGQVDMIADVDRAQVKNLEKVEGIKVVDAPPGQTMVAYITRRTSAGAARIGADIAVRQAIAHAIDRKAFVNNVLDGNATLVSTVGPPSVLGSYAGEVKGLSYDTKLSRQILDAAGWTLGSDNVRAKGGQRLSLVMVFDPARITLPVAEYVQAQLAGVGIEAKIQQLDPNAYQDVLNRGTYDIDISTPNQNDVNPAFLMALRWYSKATAAVAKPIAPGAGTPFDTLIDQVLATTDIQQAQKLSAQAMHELLDVDVAAVPLAGTYPIYAMKDTVQGFVPHPSAINQTWNTVWISQGG